MKIAQLNNQQINFNGGIVAKKGAARIIRVMYPEVAEKAAIGETVGIKDDLPKFDYFLFTPVESKLEGVVRRALYAGENLEVAHFSDNLLERHTMENFISLCDHLQ